MICRLMGRPRPVPGGRSGHRVAHLAELLEDQPLVLGAHAGAVVGDLDEHLVVAPAQPNLDATAAGLDELDCVGQQVDEDLHHAVAIGPHRRRFRAQGELQPDVLVAEELSCRPGALGDHAVQVDLGDQPLAAARIELREIEHLVDEPREPLALLQDDGEETRALGFVEAGIVVQDLGEGADRGQRRAQLVRDGGDEIVLEPVELLQPLVGGAQLLRGGDQLARLALELVAVGDDLRGLVQHAAHLGDGQRLLLERGGDEDAGGGAADGAGERGLREADQVRVLGQPGRIRDAAPSRVLGDRRRGAFRAEEARQQRTQLRQRGVTLPQVHAFPVRTLAEDVDEPRRLRLLGRALPRQHGHADERAHVRDHAPQHRVRDVVEPGQAEELRRPQQRDAARPLREESGGQPARLGERRQQQRVEPHGEPRSPGRRARPSGWRPSSRGRRRSPARTAPRPRTR